MEGLSTNRPEPESAQQTLLWQRRRETRVGSRHVRGDYKTLRRFSGLVICGFKATTESFMRGVF